MIRYSVHIALKRGYKSVQSVPHADASDDIEHEEDQESDPMFNKVINHETVPVNIRKDRPKGQFIFNFVELVSLLAEIGMCIAVISTNIVSKDATISEVGRLASWIYILLLTAARLAISSSEAVKLWNHTAFLYGLQWVSLTWLFRSVLIHPRPPTLRAFVCTQFALSSVLFIVTVSARRGNRTILVQYEDDLEPPKEQFASLFGLASYSWIDSLIWKGYKKPLEIHDVWNLSPKYKAASVLQDFQQAKKTSSLAFSLLLFFKRPLLIQGAWTVIDSVLIFTPTWLVKFILEYVQDPESHSRNAAWLFVFLIFFSGLLAAIAYGQSLWIGRKLSVKLRAIIVGELYAKALRRKAGASAAKKPTVDNPEDAIESSVAVEEDRTTDSDDLASVGTIINLMAIDSFKVSEICAYLHYIWACVPIQLFVAIALLYRLLGYSSLAGIVVMLIVMPLNVVIAKQFADMQRKILAATDARVHSTNEVMQNVRIIKYFAWESRFEGVINEKRKMELKRLRARYLIWVLAAGLWYFTPLLISFSAFVMYTTVAGKALIPSVAFPAMSMFQLLRIPLDRLADMIARVQESKVSIDRVQKFLQEEETEKYAQLKPSTEEGPPKIALEKATLSWQTRASTVNDSTDAFKLLDVDVNFHIGGLNVIAGPTGSGKSSMLLALLGEMKLLKGMVHLPGGAQDRTELRPDPATSLIESVAYCAQEAWLVNASIKENILFALPYNEDRYHAVLHGCALEQDIDILDAGDETLVGEKGISLSGGQKQRISLARAIYSNARHVLLDDCLSAVDSHTAKHIFENALSGPLMINRTCIVVTHNVSLVGPHADHIVVLNNGRIAVQGPPDAIKKSNALGEGFRLAPSRGTSWPASRKASGYEEQLDSIQNSRVTNDGTVNNAPKKIKKSSPVSNEEEKAVGSVKMATIFMYLASMGPWYYWIFAFILLVLDYSGAVASSLWIRQWANAYPIEGASSSVGSNQTLALAQPPFKTVGNLRAVSYEYVPIIQDVKESYFKGEVDVKYYMGMYLLISAAYIIFACGFEYAIFMGSLRASSIIHDRLVIAVTHAQFKFFDSTPLGRIMNRFSKDIEAVDQEVSPVAKSVAQTLGAILVIILLISFITPAFLIAAIFISIIYAVIGTFYITPSRDLKRLESVQRSPLYQQFGETLSGVVTIRAYGDGTRFLLDNHRRINTYNRPYIYLWAANRWLAFRVDITGALVSFSTAAFIVMDANRIDAGAAGVAMSYAVLFSECVLWFVRMYAENQQNMNSVERIEEYMNVDQEAPPVLPHSRPPASWPSQGEVKFVDYSTRYRLDLGLVLNKISFTALPGEQIGVVGRTGAGKSSLALALFRGLEAETGSIVIDGVDIGKIGLKDLREAITIVPQDPTLFTGTIRSNLDPFGLFLDEDIFTALHRVHLIGSTSASNTPVLEHTSFGQDDNQTQENKNMFLDLSSPIAESGSNLSQGQKQLLCLARALLKNPKVLMMDEATASIDYSTDAKIQETLREVRGSTIITIAHRLQTIIDYDKILVLERGQVVEFDSPWKLITKEGGIFRGMCVNSDDMDSLMEGARKAWETKRLVDDS